MFTLNESDKSKITMYFATLGVACVLIGAWRVGMNVLENVSN